MTRVRCAVHCGPHIRLQFSTHTLSGELVRPQGGHFEGTVGLLDSGQADVVSSGLFMYPGRLVALENTAVTSRFRTMFVFMVPNVLGSMDALSKPLHLFAWVGVGATWTAVLACDLLGAFLADETPSPGTSFTRVVGSLTGQGEATTPSGKFLRR